MQRVTGLVLSALGAFLVVLALLTQFVIVPAAVKFPLNEATITTAVANNANYFSPSKITEFTGVTLQETVSVVGDKALGNSSHAVWNEFSYLKDLTNNLTVDYSKETLAFDRKTGELLNCCGASIGSSPSVHMSGLGFLWPIGSQKKTYQYFDPTLLKPEPAVYDGTAVVDGEMTYKYVEKVAPTQSSTLTLPGSIAGINTSANVTLPEYYQGTSTFWVDPKIGAPVKEQIAEHLYLVYNGTEALNLVDGTFNSTPASISSAVSTAKTRDFEVDLARVLPLILGPAGLLLLAAGMVLVWSARRRENEADEEEAGDEPAGEGYEPERGAGEVTA